MRWNEKTPPERPRTTQIDATLAIVRRHGPDSALSGNPWAIAAQVLADEVDRLREQLALANALSELAR